MDDKRKTERFLINLSLDVSSLFKQDHVVVEDLHAPIEVINISRGGIGFKSENDLPLDYYFNAKLEMGSKDSTLFTVVKIVRKITIDEEHKFLYGAEFVGMPSVLMYIFDEYEEKMKEYKA